MYVYDAALYCDYCGEEILDEIKEAGNAPEDPADEHTYDSGDYPKGPYHPEASDVPEHCDGCGDFLENPLTEYGMLYVAQALCEGTGDPKVLRTWSDFYGSDYGWADLDYVDRDALEAWADHLGDPVEALETFEDAYAGTFESVEDYARQYVADTGMLYDSPDNLRRYFDFEAFAQDMVRGGDVTEVEIVRTLRVAIFYNF